MSNRALQPVENLSEIKLRKAFLETPLGDMNFFFYVPRIRKQISKTMAPVAFGVATHYS